MSSPSPMVVTVDLVVLTVRMGEFLALTIKRRLEPFVDRWSLPGGLVREDEDLVDAATRQLAEEAGIGSMRTHLEQLRSYGAPGRDPRGRVVSVAYLALVPDPGDPVAGADASEAEWKRVDSLLKSRTLAFDHLTILRDGVQRARAKLEYTSLGTMLIPEPFTINELRSVYAAVWAREPDPRNFHRKVSSAEGFVEPTDEASTRGGGRPARLYRRGPARLLHPPMLRA
ncbi:MAG: NUDIX domain-containing protein [Nocardioides sp.]